MDSQQKKETRREDGRQQRPYRRAGHDLQILGFCPDRTGDERLAVAGGRAGKEVAALLHIAADVGVVPQRIAAFDDRDAAGGIKAGRQPFQRSATIDVSGVVIDGEAEVERSEEHTSELQSLMRISYAVFCLKKTKKRDTKRSKHHRTENIHNKQ